MVLAFAAIGRGTFATFPARTPLLGWPLDHMFVTPEFAVRELAVSEGVGSDRLPILSRVCLTDRTAATART